MVDPTLARRASGRLIAAALLLISAPIREGVAGEISARTVTETLFKYRPGVGEVPDFSNNDISSLDLSDVDFKAARLVKADLFGVDLSRSNLKGADLTGARLDRAVITRTDFSDAYLSGVSMMRPTIFTTLQSDRRESPSFRGAKLQGARLTGSFDGTDFSGAHLDGLSFGPHDPRADISSFPRNFCRGCNFTDASLRDSDLNDASFVSARFVRADLSGASLVGTNLAGADLSFADLTGANLSGADLDGTILVGVKGLDSAKGMSLAVNADRAVR